MNLEIITPVTANIFKFYSHCFLFPYEEMNYELQNLFRIIENEDLDEDELILVDQTLSVINLYQGEEISDLRSEYVSLFTGGEPMSVVCPMIASDFCTLASKNYDSFEAEDLIYESALPINTDDPVDSVVNYLQYLSYACDEYLIGDLRPDRLRSFFKNHISYWIPLFCDLLYRSANLSFYKEVAVGLKETLLFYDTES